MVKNQSLWPTAYFNTINCAIGSMEFGTSPVYTMAYSTTTYSLTAADVLELNSRSFTVHSISVKWTKIGTANLIRIDSDIENTAGATNKYEITMPAIPGLPSLLIGRFITSHTVAPDTFDIRDTMIHEGKLRIANNNQIVISGGTYDFAFQAGRRFNSVFSFTFYSA